MTNIDDEELNKIVSAARKARGGKPAKYPELEKYRGSIEKLIENNVQLPFILKWLIDEKGEQLVLNTLRKFVVRKIGRDRYEQYLERNGWLKSKGNRQTTAGSVQKTSSTTSSLGFELSFPKPKKFKRTQRK